MREHGEKLMTEDLAENRPGCFPGRRRHIGMVVVLLLGLAVGLPGDRAWGLWMSPKPMVQQFEESYGIIASEVIEAKHVEVDPAKTYPDDYDVTFRVVRVVADPIHGEAFALKPGGTFVVRVSVGYACALESWGETDKAELTHPGGPLAAGAKYYVTVKHAHGNGTYELTQGASVLETLKAFDEEHEKDIGVIRGLALMTAGDRVQACYKILLDKATSEFLRNAALVETREQARKPEADETRKKATTEVYWKLWRENAAAWDDHSLALLASSMHVVIGKEFMESPEYRERWFERMFAPLDKLKGAELQKECIHRNNTAGFAIRGAGEVTPIPVGERLMKEMADTSWPMDIRVDLANYLLWMHDHVETPVPQWEPFLQEMLPKLIDDSESWPLRLLADGLRISAAASDTDRGKKRTFAPGPGILAALQRAHQREVEASRKDPEHRAAVVAIGEALKAMGHPPETDKRD